MTENGKRVAAMTAEPESYDCPATFPDADLECALMTGHDNGWHWDPRGVDWREEPGIEPVFGGVPSEAERENFRLERVPGLRAVTPKRDPVEPVPAGTYVAMVFRVTGYDRDCDGSLMARLENVGSDGEPTGWGQDRIGIGYGSGWVLDSPDELERLARTRGA